MGKGGGYTHITTAAADYRRRKNLYTKPPHTLPPPFIFPILPYIRRSIWEPELAERTPAIVFLCFFPPEELFDLFRVDNDFLAILSPLLYSVSLPTLPQIILDVSSEAWWRGATKAGTTASMISRVCGGGDTISMHCQKRIPPMIPAAAVRPRSLEMNKKTKKKRRGRNFGQRNQMPFQFSGEQLFFSSFLAFFAASRRARTPVP